MDDDEEWKVFYGGRYAMNMKTAVIVSLTSRNGKRFMKRTDGYVCLINEFKKKKRMCWIEVYNEVKNL